MPKKFCFFIFIFLFPCLSTAQETISDPFEPVNRGIFLFNDTLDEYALEPIATGYDHITPDSVQLSVRNFFRNLRFPIQLVSNLLQGEFTEAADDTGRFFVNSTVGVLGIFDVYGGEYTRQDLGTAFGAWGVGTGPYLVLPFLGPSNVRDASGLLLGVFLDPLFWLAQSSAFSGSDDLIIAASLTGLETINTRSRYLEIFRDLKNNSLDYYLAQQSNYLQYRAGLVRHPSDDSAEDDWFDDEEEFE